MRTIVRRIGVILYREVFRLSRQYAVDIKYVQPSQHETTPAMMMIVDDYAAHQTRLVLSVSMPWTSSPRLPLVHLPVDYSIYSILSWRRSEASEVNRCVNCKQLQERCNYLIYHALPLFLSDRHFSRIFITGLSQTYCTINFWWPGSISMPRQEASYSGIRSKDLCFSGSKVVNMLQQMQLTIPKTHEGNRW